MPVMMEKKEDAPQDVKQTYQTNLDVIFKYIESRLDILEHNILVFPCNTNTNHWVSVVVINPFLLVEVNKKTGAAYNSDLCGLDNVIEAQFGLGNIAKLEELGVGVSGLLAGHRVAGFVEGPSRHEKDHREGKWF
jgi:hypothetical protein